MAVADGDSRGIASGEHSPGGTRVARAATGFGCAGGIFGLVVVAILIAGSIGRGCTFNFGSNRTACWDSSNRLVAATGEPGAEAVRHLLAQGADPNKADSDGNRALPCAAMVGNADAVNALLVAGAHPDESGTTGGRPIVAAVSGEGTFAGGGNAPSSSDSSVFVATDSPLRAEIVKALLARGVNPNEALRPACEKGNVAAVRTLLDGGAKPDGDPSEPSPLSTAAFFGQDAVAKLLIERGADVNDGGHLDAQTAGMMVYVVPAARSGGSSRYSAWPYPLVAETSSGTSDGSSVNAPPVVVPPLVAAAVAGNATIVARLLAAGADPNRTATGGWSPLWAAVFAGDEPSLHLLLAAHAVDAPPSDPTSATLLADHLNEPRMVWFITSGS